jgi:mRNA interferase HigB
MVHVNTKLLDHFARDHASTEKASLTWRKSVEEADWKKKQDVLDTFPNAKMIKNNRARFEIQHNKYRLIAESFMKSNCGSQVCRHT